MKKIKNIFKRHTLIASFLLVFAIAGVAGTVALAVATSDPVTNTFKAASLDTDITEEGSSPDEKIVTITNQKDSPAYIRVRITVSPENATKPLTIKDGWLDGNDGFYYYHQAVEGNGGKTNPIIDSIDVDEDYAKTKEPFDVTVYQESCVATKAPGETVTLEDMKNAFNAASGSVTDAGN